MKSPVVKPRQKKATRKLTSAREAFTLNDVLAGDIVGRRGLRTSAPVLNQIKSKYRAAS